MKTNRSNLPAGTMRQGLLPTKGSDFAAEIAGGFKIHMDAYRRKAFGLDDDQDGSIRPTSRPDVAFRHSDAAGCACQLSYKMQKLAPSNPPTLPDLLNMFWGTIIHEHADHALAAAGWAETDVETPTGWDIVTVEGKPVFIPMSTPAALEDEALGRRPFSAGTIDGRHEYEIGGDECGADEDQADTRLRVVENKSQADYAFRLHSGLKGEAEGPAWSAIVQGALNAEAEQADELVVLDIAKNVISKPDAAKFGLDELERIFAPYHFDRTTPIAIPTNGPDRVATFPQIAQRELRRVRRVHELTVAGEGVPRVIDDPEVPTNARIVKPDGPKGKGVWQVRGADGSVFAAGEYWGCGYCWHRARCVEDLAREQLVGAAPSAPVPPVPPTADEAAAAEERRRDDAETLAFKDALTRAGG